MLKMTVALVAAVGLMSTGSASSQTAAAAAAQGKALGQSTNPTTSSNINSVTGANTVPGYATTSPEAAYFGGGNGSVAAPTASKLAACATSTTAECVAINLMRNKSTTANPITINPLSPLIVNARAVTNAPAGALGVTNGIFVEPAAGSACLPGTTVTGTGSITETCEERIPLGEEVCQRPWELEIQPWWSYTCEKSDVTVTRATCDRTLQVTVDWVSNCAIGENVVEQGFGWDYNFRSGLDLYQNGGVVRAKCFPAQADTVRMTLWGGDVVQNDFGSGAVNSPPPNVSLLPTGDSMDVPTTVGALITAPTSGIMILPGSGCVDGICRYQMSRGTKRWECPNWIGWETNGSDGPFYTIDRAYDEGYSGGVSGLACYGEPIVAPRDNDGNPICAGSYYYNGMCYPSSPTAPVVVGAGSGGRSWSVVFTKPAFVPQTTDTWISTCGALEGNPSCTMVGESCTDGPSSKTINGAEITRACWKQKVDFECLTAGGNNACAPLMAEPLCSQNSVDECIDYSSNGTCISFKAGYKCTKEMGPIPGITETGEGYDVIKDAIDESQCAPFATNPDCVKRSSVCTDSGTKTFFGFEFTKVCWNYEETYSCPVGAPVGDCQPLIDKPCTLIPALSTCVSTYPSGLCDVMHHTYECGSPTSSAPTGALCESTPYCINGVCYERERPSDPDFGTAVAAQETARQVGNYLDEGSLQVFIGSPDTCTKKLLANCCKGNGSSGNVTNSAFFTAVDFGRKFAGSMYMYDTLFSSSLPDIMVNGLSAMGITSAVGANTFTAYGVTLGWGSSGFTIVAFDPWSFAAQIAIQIIVAELMSCDDPDKQTAVKKDQGICHRMGTFCSKKFLGMCLESKESYCCFNSKLAKAINIGGKQQLGITMGSAEGPNCRGLTIAEVQSIDMTQVDLSEFLADIVGNVIPKADAETETSTSIGNRSPCTDVHGNVDPQQAGRMECNPMPTPNGSSTPGPGTVPTPVDPPPPDPMPDVTVSFLPASAEFGMQIIATTQTVNATALNYVCTGGMTLSGALPIGTAYTTIDAVPEWEGITVCLLTASNGTKERTVEGTFEITKLKPKISVTITPNPVFTGAAFDATIITLNSDSAEYTCSGVIVGAGPLAVGSTTLNLIAPIHAGTAVCTVIAKGNGFTTTYEFTITVDNGAPLLTFTATPEPVPAGQTVTFSVAPVGAVSVTSTCSGSLVSAGLVPADAVLPISSSSWAVVTNAASLGSTTCTVRAKSASGSVKVVTLTVTVERPVSSVTASFSVATVKVGSAYSLSTNTVGMSSLTWQCVGPKVGSGALPIGANVIDYVATASEVGTTVCTFTGIDAITLESKTASASINVRDGQTGVSASWSTAVARVGETVQLNTTTVDAVSASYTCLSPMATSGVIPLSPSSTPFLFADANIGRIPCVVTATGASGQVARASVSIEVKPRLPTMVISVSPAVVNVGAAYRLTTNAQFATSASVVCTGAAAQAGPWAIGPVTVDYTALIEHLGVTTCVFKAVNEIGEAATASGSIEIRLAPPTVSASLSTTSVRAGDSVTLSGTSTDATSMSYSCTGAVTRSGALSVPNGSVSVPTSSLGTANCSISASGPGGSASSSVSFTVIARLPEIVVIVPGTVRVGQVFNLQTLAYFATSLSMNCPAPILSSGPLPVGNNTFPLTAQAAWLGTTTCTFTVNNAAGETASTSASITVIP